MWSLSQRYLDTLARSHDQLIAIDVLKNGQVVASLQNGWMTDPATGERVATIGGSISVDKTSVRRSGTVNFIDVSGKLLPDSVDDLFAPYSTEMRVYVGVRYWDAAALTGTDTDYDLTEYVPVGTLVITHLSNDYPQISIQGYDRAWYLDNFQSPWTIAGKTNVGDAISQLLQLKVPAPVLDYDVSLSSEFTTTALIYDADTSSADALFNLAGNAGYAFYADPMGKFLLADEPSTDDDPVMTYAAGALSTLGARPSRTIGEAQMYNAVVVTSEGSTTTPIRGYAQDDNPDSLTYAGAIGVHPTFVSDATITTQAQANRAAQRKLRSILGVSLTVAVPLIPNHALESGDVIVVSDDLGHTDSLLIDSFTVPLRAQDGVQSLTCRSNVISAS